MEFDFFFKVDSGRLVFLITDILSAFTMVGPSNGTPIIRSLYLKPSANSTPTFIAVNSEPKKNSQ